MHILVDYQEKQVSESSGRQEGDSNTHTHECEARNQIRDPSILKSSVRIVLDAPTSIVVKKITMSPRKSLLSVCPHSYLSIQMVMSERSEVGRRKRVYLGAND